MISRPWSARAQRAPTRSRRAESIVEQEAARFRDWQASLEVVPAIAPLREWAEGVRSGELAKAEASGAPLDSERETVESLTTQIVNKLLHLPIVRLKQAAATDGPGYVTWRGTCSASARRTAVLVRVGTRGSSH